MESSKPTEGFDAHLIATFKDICKLACERLNVHHSGFVQFNHERTAGTVVAEYPSLPAGPLLGRVVKLKGIRREEELLATDEPLVINDVEKATDLGEVRDLLLAFNIRSVCVVKVRYHGVEIGSFSFDSVGEARTFTFQDQEHCQEFADTASKILQTMRDRYRLDSLSKRTVAITSEDRPAELLKTIVKEAKVLFSAESAGVYKREPDENGNDSLILAASSQSGLVGKRLTKPEGMAWQLILSDVPFIQTHNYDTYDHRSANFEEGQFGSVIEVPLFKRDERIGVIYLADRRGQIFSPFDVGLLQRFADVAAVGIQNAALIERMKDLSVASSDIASAFTFRRLTLQRIAQHTTRLLNAEACDVFSVKGRALVLEAHHAEGVGRDEPLTQVIEDEFGSDRSGAIAARLITRYESGYDKPHDDEWLVYTDSESSARHAGGATGEEPTECSTIAVLLVTHTPTGERVSGLLRASNKRGADGKPHPSVRFGAEDERVARIVAQSVVVGMEGARLFESLQHQKDLANTLASGADLDVRLQKVASTVVTMMDRSFCRVLLTDDSEGFLTLRAAALHADVAESVSWKPAGLQRTPITDWPHLQQALADGSSYELAAANSEQHRILEQLSDLFDIRRNGTRVSIASMFGVPMILGHHIIGLLSVGDFDIGGTKPPFADEEKHAIQAIAAQATVTIDKERQSQEEVRSSKRREETLKYLALFYIKCGVVLHNHHGTALTLYQWAEALEHDAQSEAISEKLLTDARWLKKSAKALCDVIVAGPFSFEVPPVREINAVIQEWIQGLDGMKGWQDIAVAAALSATVGVSIRIDADLLKEVFLIFGNNARKEMMDMRTPLARRFNITTSIDEGTRIVIAFSDTGRGIPPEKLARIRTDLRTGVTEDRNRGLGLVTAQLIMTRFGGEVLEPLSSDKGTTFMIVMPPYQAQP